MSDTKPHSEDDQLRRYRDLILAATGDGVYGLDVEGRTTFTNPAALRMSDYTADEMLGLGQHDLIHHSHADGSPYPKTECPIYAAFKDGEVRQVSDEVFWRKDGTAFPVEYVSTPIWDDGKLVGAVVSFRDISERKAAEAALQDSEERYRALQSDLQHASRLGAMGEMASGIAHELNQPLTAIGNYVQAARRKLESGPGAVEPETLALLEKAALQSQRAADIVRGVRRFVSKSGPAADRADLNTIVAEAISLATFGDKAQARRIRFDPAPRPAFAEIDRIGIQQVVVNLVRNGLDAIQALDDGELTVRISLSDKAVQVCVIDNGPGFEAEIEAQLFRPFVTTKPSGMGLGLSICQSIVKNHSGTLDARSNDDRGVTFTFELPLYTEAVETNRAD